METKSKFDPIKNSPVSYEVFDKDGVSVLKTKSLNNASDKCTSIGLDAKIIATDCKGNIKDLSLIKNAR